MALDQRYQAGTAWVKVSPDFRGWQKKMREQVKNASEDYLTRVSLDLDTKEARAALREFEANDANVTANVKVDKKDLARARAQLDSLDKNRRVISVRTEVDNDRIRQQIKGLDKQFRDVAFRPDIKINDKSINKQFDKLRQRVAKMSNAGGVVDSKAYKSALDSAARLDAIENERLRAAKQRERIEKSINDESEKANERYNKIVRERANLNREAKRIQDELAKSSSNIAKLEEQSAKHAARKTELAEREAQAKKDTRQHERALRDLDARRTAIRSRRDRNAAALPGVNDRVGRIRPTGDVHEWDIEHQIIRAFQKVRKDGNGSANIADIRDLTKNTISRADFDAAIRRLDAKKGALAYPNDDRASLTNRDRASAVRIGSHENHKLSLEGYQEPSKPRKALSKADEEAIARQKSLNDQIVADEQEIKRLGDERKKIRAQIDAAKKREKRATTSSADVGDGTREAANLRSAKQSRIDNEKQLLKTQGKLEDSVEDLSDAYEDLERVRSKGNQRELQELSAIDRQLARLTKSRDAAKRVLDRSERELEQRRGVGADRTAKIRRPSLESSDTDTGTDHVARVNSAIHRAGIGNSPLASDIAAMRDARVAAAALDSELARLARANSDLSRTERDVAAATAEVNRHRENGTITSDKGIASVERETRALEKYHSVANTIQVTSQKVNRLRGDYNRMAGTLGSRLNENGIRRFADTLDHRISQAVTKATSRVVLLGRVFSSVATLAGASAVGFAALGAVNLVPLVGTLSQVAGTLGILPGLAAAAATAIAAIGIGMSGITSAFKAGTALDDATGAGGGGADNSKSIRSAQKALDKAHKDVGKTAAQGAEQIADAEKNVQQAQKDSVKAQKDLTNARKDAIQQAEDLKDAVDGIALSERDAQLSVEEAAKRMREVNADPDSDSLDRRRAKLSYDQAVEAQKNLRKENQKTRAEYAETQRKGVEGSDQVVEAQDRVKEAQQGIVDAQKDLVKTQQDAADANADALDRVADAQEALSDAMNGGSGGGGPTPLDKFNAELDKLAPNAQALVVGLRAMKDNWTDLRKSTQQNLFHGVAEDITQLAEKDFPLLKRGLADVATGLNGGFRHFFTYLKSEKGYADFSSIFKNSGAAMGDLSVATSNFLQALSSVAEVGTRFMPWFGRTLSDTAKNWRSMADDAQANGSMESFFVRAINRSKQLGGIFYDLGSIIKNTFSATSELGEDSLLHIERSLDTYAAKLRDASGQNGVREFFQDVRNMLHDSAQILGNIGQLVTQHLVPAFQIINNVLGPITQSLAAATSALGQIPVLGSGIKYIIALMLALKIASAAGGFAGKIGDKVSPAAMNGLRTMRTTIAGIGTSSNAAAASVGRIGTAAASATTPAMRLAAAVDKVRGGPYAGSSARLGIAASIGAISAPANTAVGAMGRLQGSLGKVQSVGATAFSKIKSSAMSAVDFLGGPVGIAITGVVIGLTMWYSAVQKVKSANDQLNASMQRLNDSSEKVTKALVAARGASDPEVISASSTKNEDLLQTKRDRISSIGAQDSVGSNIGNLLTGHWDDLKGGSRASSRDKEKDQLQAEIDLLNKLKISSEDVASAVNGTDEEWDKFIITILRDATPATAGLIKELRNQRNEVVNTREEVALMTPGYMDLSDALEDLSKKTNSVADATEALRKVFDALNPNTQQLDALGEYGEALDAITDKINNLDPSKGFGASELLRADGSLNTVKDNARELRQMIEDGFTSISASAMQGEDIGPLFADYTAKLKEFGAAAGLSEQEMDGLLKKMNLTPKAIATTISVQGADATTKALAKISLLAEDADNNGQPRVITMEMADENTRNALREMGISVEAVAGHPNLVTVNLQDNGSLERLQEIQKIIAGNSQDWTTLQQNVRLGADGQILVNTNIPGVQDELKRLSIRTTTLPNGDVVINPEDKAFYIAVAEATKTRDATINITPVIDWSMVPDWVPIPGRPTSQNGQGIPQQGGGQYGNIPLPGGHYRGGRLPLFARGGRMPTSGPGTEKRDGFLAVGPDGKPQARVDGGEWIINDAMSKKYNGLLALINADKLKGYAAGGRMGARSAGNQGAFGLGVIGNPFANMASGVMGLGAAFGDALGTAIPEWQRFGNTLSSTASKFISPALSGVNSAIDEMGTDFPLITQTKIIPPWSQMSTFLSNQKASVLDPMFAGIQTSATAMGLWFGSMASRVQPTWLSMATQLMAAKTGTIDPVFNGIESGLTTVEQAFATAVPSIAAQWNGMREATAAPVRFTINTVFNDGLIATWNSVADLTGAKKMTGKPAAFARGGVLPGYTPGRDVHKFFSPTGGELHLSGGEAVMRPEWVRAQGGPSAIDKMNAEARQGTPQKVRNSKTGSDYADGGTVAVGYGLPPGSSVSYGAPGFPDWVYALGRAHGVQPSTYPGHQESDRAEAGYAPNPQHLNRGIDWSGPVNSMQAFAQYLLGIAPSTPTLEQIIWQNPSTGQQIGWHGRVPDIGGGYFAADYPGHTDHVHTRQSGPIAPGAVASALGSSTGMALGAVLDTASVIRSMLDPKLAETQKKIAATKFGGVVGGVPQAAFDSAKKPLVDKAIELAKNTMASVAGPGAANYLSGANIPGDIKEKVRKAFEMYGWGSGPEWEAAQWIITHESGWNPTAVNPSSGAWGLGQFLGCVPLDTQIHTQRGWLKYSEVRPGDLTIGYNPETGSSEWTEVLEVMVDHSPNELWEIGTARWRATVTPGHRWMTTRRVSRGGSRNRIEDFAITAELTSEHDLVLAAVAETGEGLPISSDEAELLGWLAGDGSIEHSATATRVSLWQSKPHRVDEIRELLSGIPHSEYERKMTNRPAHYLQAYCFYIHADTARDILDRSGYSDGWEIMVSRMSHEQRLRWLKGIDAAEGTDVVSGSRSIKRIPQNDGEVQDAIVMCAYLLGYRPSVRRRSNQPGFGMVTLARPGQHVSKGFETREVEAAGIWCVRTELGTWTMRQGDQVSLTGNSTKDAYYPSNDPDPYKQGQAIAKYMKDRYGTPSAAKQFWMANNWYDRGGMWPSGTTGINMSGKPEAVFTNPQWKMLEKLVESLLNPKMFRALTDQKKVSLGRTPTADDTVPLGSQQTAQREYTPAWEDPDTKAPYITDPETGVPIDPKTNKVFTEDPDTHKPITKDDKTGLYVDPRTGKYFYGSDATDLDAKASSGADAPKRSYTPAWTDKDGKPYEVDPVTGVPIDPATGKPFTEDPESHSDIKLDDTTGLYVDPKTGSYFYGSKAKDLDAQDGNKQGDPNAALDPANQFSFDDPNNPDGTPDDWTENYTGPFSDIIKKGKLLGQLGNALIQPGAIQRIGNDAEMNKQIDLAKTREEALNTYKTEQAQKISELRAAGKTEEAAALEKESRAKIAGMKELPGSSPGTQAMLATMEKNPSETWKKQSAQQWQSWLGENWAGIAESAAVVGAQGAGQVGGGLTVMGDLNTGDGFHTVIREMDRREARASRANSRRGGR